MSEEGPEPDINRDASTSPKCQKRLNRGRRDCSLGRADSGDMFLDHLAAELNASFDHTLLEVAIGDAAECRLVPANVARWTGSQSA